MVREQLWDPHWKQWRAGLQICPFRAPLARFEQLATCDWLKLGFGDWLGLSYLLQKDTLEPKIQLACESDYSSSLQISCMRPPSTYLVNLLSPSLHSSFPESSVLEECDLGTLPSSDTHQYTFKNWKRKKIFSVKKDDLNEGFGKQLSIGISWLMVAQGAHKPKMDLGSGNDGPLNSKWVDRNSSQCVASCP